MKSEPSSRKNEQIRYSKVLLIYDGQKLGEMSSREALQKAQSLGLDLVEVSPNARPPVCIITDFGKFQYDKSKKQKKNQTVKEKEFAFRYVIDSHDLQTKMNQAKKFLQKGDRVKITIKFKARENAHKEEGWKVIKEAIGMLEEVGSLEKPPAYEGSNIVAKLIAKK